MQMTRLSSLKTSLQLKCVKTFKEFSCFSELKPNIAKCEIAGLGPLKRLLEEVCGLKTVDLTNDAIKVLGIHFS